MRMSLLFATARVKRLVGKYGWPRLKVCLCKTKKGLREVIIPPEGNPLTLRSYTTKVEDGHWHRKYAEELTDVFRLGMTGCNVFTQALSAWAMNSPVVGASITFHPDGTVTIQEPEAKKAQRS